MKTLLRSKIRPVNDLAKGGTWAELHLQLADKVAELLGQPIIPFDIKEDTQCLSDIQSRAANPSVFYGVETPDHGTIGLIKLSQTLSAQIACRATESSQKPEDYFQSIGLLDIHLGTILQQTILDYFSGRLKDYPLNIAVQTTEPSSLNVGRPRSQWDSFQFTFNTVGDDDASIGSLTLYISHVLRVDLKMSATPDPNAPRIDMDGPWAGHMTRSVADTQILLRAVLETRKMSVAECTRLKIGDVIDFPDVSTQSVMVETRLPDGRLKVSSGMLGGRRGKRVLQLAEDVSPSFADPDGIFKTIAS